MMINLVEQESKYFAVWTSRKDFGRQNHYIRYSESSLMTHLVEKRFHPCCLDRPVKRIMVVLYR